MGTSILGASSVASQMTLQQARETQMLQQMSTLRGEGQGTKDQDAKIEKGAKQFEAMLLSSWLQQAEQSFATVPGADDDESATTGKDQLMSLGVQSLAESLAASGGIGIAAMISKAMHAAADKVQPANHSENGALTEGNQVATPAQQIHQKI